MAKTNHFYPAEYTGICVVKRESEDEEDLIRRFRKKYSKSGINRELREKMYFEKPSQKRRRKREQSIRLKEKEEKKLQDMIERAKIKKMKYKRKNIKRRNIKND